MTQPSVKLPRGAEELLVRFPTSEPDFEAQAQAIQARITSAVTDDSGLDDVFGVPALAAEPGEPGGASDVRAAQAPKTSFAEMARKSLQKKDDDSELAKELLAATAQSRRPDAEMVERVRAAGRSSSAGSTPLPVQSQRASTPDREAAEEQPRPSGVVARAVAPAPAPAAAPPSNRGTVIGIVGVAFGIAACVALFLKTGPSDSPTAATLAAEQEANRAAASPQAQPTPMPVTAKEPEGVMSPDALAIAPTPAAHDAAKGAPKSAVAAAAPAAAAKPGPAPSAVPQEAVELQDDPPPVAAAEPKPAEQKAPEPQLKPAEGNTGDVPLTPSAGAVSTALSSVRSGAQACLAGQTESVTATVVFAADGHVQRVSAGGPSGACIQAALSKARIAPFARESFSTSLTIRPP